METQFGVYVPFSVVYPSIPDNFETFKYLLHNLSRTDAIFWCARLNKIISSPSDLNHKERQQFGLSQFMPREDIDKVNSFTYEKGGAERVIIFFRGQILELVRWILLYSHDHEDDGVTFEDADVRRKFAQALLLASDIWARRVFGKRFRDTGDILQDRSSALGATRKALEDTFIGLNIPQSIGRGWTLFKDIFPRHYQEFEEEFNLITGLTLEEYYTCLCALTTSFIYCSENSEIFSINELDRDTPYESVISKYLALESQTIDELKNALWNSKKIAKEDDACFFDYLPMRQRPIVHASDGRSIIIDPRFYSERASIGPLFYLLSEDVSRKKANKIFSAFGETVETYCCDILERMYPTISPLLHKRLVCNLRGIDQQGNNVQIADACLNDVTEAILFQIKSVWIREKDVLADDPEKFVQHLRERYVLSEKDTKNLGRRGIDQLARSINKLASGEWRMEEQDFSKVDLIYPVLVAHDPLIDSPVYAYFLASEFKNLLAPDEELRSGEMRKGKFRVTPLILITLEELENLETSIENLCFRELLNDYSDSSPDRLVSLHNFMAFSKYRNLYRHNRTLAGKAYNALSKTLENIFPKQQANT